MDAAPKAERRQHSRQPLSVNVKFFHEPSQHAFSARTVDASPAGLLMYVPAVAPLQVGHILRVNLGELPQPQHASLSGREFSATVVRVDRRRLIPHGHIAVGVKFSENPPG
jgi:hypothetical protein